MKLQITGLKHKIMELDINNDIGMITKNQKRNLIELYKILFIVNRSTSLSTSFDFGLLNMDGTYMTK